MSISDESPNKTVSVSGKPKRSYTLSAILAVLLIALIAAAFILLKRPVYETGVVTVSSGGISVELPGEEVLRNQNGTVTFMNTESPEEAADAPHIAYSDSIEFRLDGKTFDQTYYVSTYSDSYELLTEDADHPVLPSDPGSYLLRIEVFWGDTSNFVSGIHYVWIDVQ